MFRKHLTQDEEQQVTDAEEWILRALAAANPKAMASLDHPDSMRSEDLCAACPMSREDFGNLMMLRTVYVRKNGGFNPLYNRTEEVFEPKGTR